MRHALDIRREDDFAAWYQAVISQADLAEDSGVRGCMVIKPWGWGIWERIQRLLDERIKATGHENCYFPLFIPVSYFAKEAEHVEGFAKEMAVVTHHRLKLQDGELVVDPDARLEEPLVVRPTSETVIGQAMSRWVQSWRDLPLLINQWANVVRWEMRTRMFLRTSEFLWQEGHTAHADKADAMAETLKMLEVYREFSETVLAMPVIAGEKPENERFPGADATYSIEAMMQDGKALQAGTSHYLGTTFAQAADIRYQDDQGQQQLCHTTSWGVSTRLIGGVIMTHGDDDGLCVPPAIAPHQIIILPLLRGKEEDAQILAFCDKVRMALVAQDALREPIRVLLDTKGGKPAVKRWSWVRRGAPLIIEVGTRDMEAGQLSILRRDRLWRDDGKPDFFTQDCDAFAAAAGDMLAEMQQGLYDFARMRRDGAIRRDVASMADLAAHFADAEEKPGWVALPWARPTGGALDAIVEQMKGLKITIRNTPLDEPAPEGRCFFTAEPAVETIYVGRAY
ncbi:proline--tRNA ligase [Croceicoccus sp. F390]|uniref:Proline--tRNA ligase n=1 Tax=Croceicoccus esteveae TaxID=3075597 RepID=A0ABU2ZG05_9SPHN|nr:proline--tRNA ligase [Croceicoccus sp. F390]MDT0575531.1 proline--tRNA ligase [Croceicoccus sp. F390]